MADNTNEEDIDDSSLYKAFKDGIYSGIIGQYISDVVVNMINDTPKIITNISSTGTYYAGVLSGGLAGYTSIYLDPIANTFVLVGFYYLIYAYVENKTRGLSINKSKMAKDIITDSIAIIILLLIFTRNTYLEFLNARRKRRNLEQIEIEESQIDDLIGEIVVGIYFYAKDIIGI